MNGRGITIADKTGICTLNWQHDTTKEQETTQVVIVSEVSGNLIPVSRRI